MSQYPVLQPNGKLAVWSTIVDHFIALDCTPDETVEVLAHRYPDRAKVAERVAAVQRGEKVHDHWDDWPDCVAWAMNLHGPDDETVKDAMALTPDPMTRRYIDQVVATCKVERIADDARYELERVQVRAEATEERVKELEAKLSQFHHTDGLLHDALRALEELTEAWSLPK